MKKIILLFAFIAFVSCGEDQTDENNAIKLQQIENQNATGKDCGSSPGHKGCDE